MATNIQSTIGVYLRAYGAKKTAQSITRTIHPLRKLRSELGGAMKAGTLNAGALPRSIKKAMMPLKPFRMEFLSTMFMGMAVWRVFKGLFDGMITTMKKLGGKFHPVNLAITRMAVSWEIMKFSVLNAMSPLIMKMAEWVSGIGEWFQALDPKTLNDIGVALGVIGASGLFLLTGSQLALFAGAVSNLGKLVLLDPLVLTAIATALALFGAIKVAFEYNKDEIDTKIDEIQKDWKDRKFGEVIVDAIGIQQSFATGLALGFKDFLVKWYAGWGEGIGTVAGMFYSLFEELSILVMNLWKAMFDPDLTMRDALAEYEKAMTTNHQGVFEDPKIGEAFVTGFKTGWENMRGINTTAGEFVIQSQAVAEKWKNNILPPMFSVKDIILPQINEEGRLMNEILSAPVTKTVTVNWVHVNKDDDDED